MNLIFNENGADNSFFNSLCWLSIWTAGILFKRKTFSYVLALIDEQEKEATIQLYEELHSNIEVSDWAWWKECEFCELSWVPCLCWDTLCIHHVWVSCHVWCRKLGFHPFSGIIFVFYQTHSMQKVQQCVDVDPCDLGDVCSVLGHCHNFWLLFGLCFPSLLVPQNGWGGQQPLEKFQGFQYWTSTIKFCF